MKVSVIRLGHRKERDKRITTHVCLVARALGADGVVLCGEEDPQVISSVEKVVENWGGKFSAKYEKSWKKAIAAPKKKGECLVHLTMYGERVQDVIGKIRTVAKRKNIVVAVGAEKVPGEVYDAAEFNVCVASQPHSEVAALAIFLHELFQGKELEKKFAKPRIAIVPTAKGKKVIGKK